MLPYAEDAEKDRHAIANNTPAAATANELPNNLIISEPEQPNNSLTSSDAAYRAESSGNCPAMRRTCAYSVTGVVRRSTGEIPLHGPPARRGLPVPAGAPATPLIISLADAWPCVARVMPRIVDGGRNPFVGPPSQCAHARSLDTFHRVGRVRGVPSRPASGARCRTGQPCA
jgi:hypothetical protein